MTDRFFTTPNCDRCQSSLKGKARKMSWFTEECLCEICIKKEMELKMKLADQGIDVSKLEGCGYMPDTGEL